MVPERHDAYTQTPTQTSHTADRWAKKNQNQNINEQHVWLWGKSYFKFLYQSQNLNK
jgi:hypothetical protein